MSVRNRTGDGASRASRYASEFEKGKNGKCATPILCIGLSINWTTHRGLRRNNWHPHCPARQCLPGTLNCQLAQPVATALLRQHWRCIVIMRQVSQLANGLFPQLLHPQRCCSWRRRSMLRAAWHCMALHGISSANIFIVATDRVLASKQ